MFGVPYKQVSDEATQWMGVGRQCGGSRLRRLEEVPSFANVDLLSPVYVTGSKHSESNLHPSSVPIVLASSPLPQLSSSVLVTELSHDGYVGRRSVCFHSPSVSMNDEHWTLPD